MKTNEGRRKRRNTTKWRAASWPGLVSISNSARTTNIKKEIPHLLKTQTQSTKVLAQRGRSKKN